MPFTPQVNATTSEFANTKCQHPYATKDCPHCNGQYCYNCCAGTNVDQGGKYEHDYMFCPHCGKDFYDQD